MSFVALPQPELPRIAGFSDHCRHWRKQRGHSQLTLAMLAGISQKHLSWLETGKSKPSREMVLKIAGSLDLPLRSQNAMLQAAGFSGQFSEHDLQAPEMQIVTDAVQSVLDHHSPYPAVVLDRFWYLKMANQGALQLLEYFVDGDDPWVAVGDDGNMSLARLTLHPAGMRRYIANWAQIAPTFVQRIQKELSHARDPALTRELNEILALVDDVVFDVGQPILPVLPIAFDNGGLVLKLFSVFTSFGTPQDITAEELRIESFYPSDSATRSFFPIHRF